MVELKPTTTISFPPPRVTAGFDCNLSRDGLGLFPNISFNRFFKNIRNISFGVEPSSGSTSHPLVTVASRSRRASVKSSFDLFNGNSLIEAGFAVGSRLKFKGAHDFKAREGEMAMVARLDDRGYKFELSSDYKFELESAVPCFSSPKAKLKFPLGEVGLDEKRNMLLSLNGIHQAPILNGGYTANFKDKNVDLMYTYIHKKTAFTPRISLPSKALSFGIGHRLSTSDSFGCWCNDHPNYLTAGYKHKFGRKDYELSDDNDSGQQPDSSPWVGGVRGEVECQLNVRQDDIRSSSVEIRFKKRWDVL